MSLASKLKVENLGSLFPVAFYGIVGVLFLVMLPLNSYPPHIGLTGILSLVLAYGLFTKRFWGPWLVVALFFVATVLAIFSLYYTLASDFVVSLGMIAYLVLTWLFTAYILNNRSRFEP